MRKRPNAIAWLIIWISFGVFLVSCATLVGGVVWYKGTASEVRGVTVRAIQGTVTTQQHGRDVSVAAEEDRDIIYLREGDSVTTDNTSRALITFFDNSTLTLWPGSKIILDSLRQSRFSPHWTTIQVTQARGKARVGVAPSMNAQSNFLVRSLRSLATLRDGSYSVETSDTGMMEIAVRDGRARVEAAGVAADLTAGQRLVVPSGKEPAPLGPVLPASKELVRNGDFAQGLVGQELVGWEWGNVDVAEGSPAGRASLDNTAGNISLVFDRSGSQGAHAETRIVQNIERDVSDYLSLRLSFKMRITSHSLSGGGFFASEYPIMVQVRYRGMDGGDWTWLRGFYTQNTDGNPVTNGEKIEPDTWVQFSRDLMDPNVSPRPAQIVWIKISAAGHDYHSQVSQISLLGE